MAILTNIEVIEIGIPGPQGAGVSAAEKASYAAKTGANTFTAGQIIQKSGGALYVRQDDGTTVLLVNTTGKNLELRNAAGVRWYSDDGTTETAAIDGATGNAQFDGAVTAARIVGDTSIWSFVIDGGGSPITTGVKYDAMLPYNAIVTGWDIVADQTGSIVVDLWSDSYANFPPTNADSMTTGEKPVLSSAQKNQDLSLNGGSGWAVTQGRYLRLNVDSAATVQRVTLSLHVTRT